MRLEGEAAFMEIPATSTESRTASKKRRKERGQSLIEFALTAPMLIVLLLGLVEMGHAFNSYMTIVAASRDAARLGAQRGATGGDTAMRNLVKAEIERLPNAPIPSSCNADNPGICITSGFHTPTIGGPTDKWVDVKVCYNHSMIIGIPGVLDHDINMCSHTTIRIANPASS
jgi:TadE-like protein